MVSDRRPECLYPSAVIPWDIFICFWMCLEVLVPTLRLLETDGNESPLFFEGRSSVVTVKSCNYSAVILR
jgi:hypothetical protein